MTLVERIRSRPNDAPIPTEHLLDEAANLIEMLTTGLQLARAYVDAATVFPSEAEKATRLLRSVDAVLEIASRKTV